VSTATQILIVEDSPTQAELLKYLLEQAGYRVTHAADGPQALAAARREKPSLIISDVEMPAMDGYQFCRQLKSDPQLRDVAVILMTALADVADVFRGLEAGTDGFLTKPYDSPSMLRCIESLLSSAGVPPADAAELPLEVVFEGRRHVVAAGRRQILNLLLSTFGIAVRRNRELLEAQRESLRLVQKLTGQAKHPPPSQ
jgi:CheY-like chemotaxis protein